MPVSTDIEVKGVKETIKELRKIDPEFRKQFNKAAKDVAAPMVAEAKSLYPQLPLSGMSRAWTPKAFSIFPWQVNKVRTATKLKVSTRRDKNSVLYISQGNPAGVLFETISTGNQLGANIRSSSPRVLWPVYEKHAPRINEGVEKIVREAEKTVAIAIAQGRIR
jgi:hypothetical protein